MQPDWNKYDRAFLAGIDLHTLIPQQEPFVMVGRLCAIGPDGAATETPISEDNIFVDSGSMSASGLLENMAQTHAARLGFINKYILGKDLQTGVIGAIKNACIERLPKVGETLVTTVKITGEAFGMVLSEVVSTTDQGPVATAEMKIAVKENQQ